MTSTVLEKSTLEEQIVAFQLENETYGVEIACINEIIRLPEITPVPRTTNDIKGVMNLRGKIMPVMDLRKRLGLPEVQATRATRVIVIEKQENAVGFIVDNVLGVMRLAEENIEPPTQIVADLDASYLRGVGKKDDDLILLLNMDRILEMAR